MKDFVDTGTGEIFSDKEVISFGDYLRFHDAFLLCQMDLPLTIGKDKDANIETKTGKKFKIKFAPLSKIIETVRPIVNNHKFTIDHGVCFASFSESSSKCAVMDVFTDLRHAPTGIYKRCRLPIPMPRLDPQAAGSALTFGKRYTVLAVLGISDGDSDDDGQSAMPRKITEDEPDSPDLAKLKTEINKFKEATELVAWAGDDKFKKRVNDLSEREAENLRFYFRDKRDALVSEAQKSE